MTRVRGWLLGVAAVMGAAAATPSAALTTVHFKFNANSTTVRGDYTVNCPPGSGPCTVVALTGTFGGLPITLAAPPYAPSAAAPDNLLSRPDFTPTANGVDFDFWPAPTIGPEDWKIWQSIVDRYELEKDYVAYVDEYLITDYKAYVPEPATWTMLILGLGAVGAVLRRRKTAVAA